MAYFLYGLFFLSCIVLVASVLLQPGKTDAGALFTSNISSTAFQPRGAQTILSKITIAAATIFMLSALLLAMPALTGNISVLQTTDPEAPVDTPVTSTDTNANLQSNANVPANINVQTNAEGVTVTAETPQSTPAAANANTSANAPANTANK